MRVLALVEGRDSASARLRLDPLLPALSQRGVEVVVESIVGSGPQRWRQIARARQFDVVWWQRRLPQPWESAWLRRCARRLVVDLDDAVWRRDAPPHESCARRWRARSLLARADLVTVGSRSLAAELAELRVDARFVATPVSTEESDAPDRVPPADESRGAPRLLWIGQPSTWTYVEPLLGQWGAVRRAWPGIRLAVLGAPSSSGGEGIEVIPWSPAAERAALSSATLGLAPLPDDAWTRGKCGARLQSYSAAGLPALASPVGAQAELMREFGGAEAWLPGEAAVTALRRAIDGALPLAAAAAEAARKLRLARSVSRVAAEWLAAVVPGGGGVAETGGGR